MVDIKDLIKRVNPRLYSQDKTEDGKARSNSSYSLTYDAQTNQIEPIYYWLLDFVKDAGWKIEKLTDSFMSTPGSGQFDEIGRKLGTMQEKASSYLGAINQVTKSILQLIYDLKEFEIRLKTYEDAESKDKIVKEAGILSLKQVWLDNVDSKRGVGSIHQMSYQGGYTLLREVFMASNSLEDVKKIDGINEQVKTIVLPRLSEFLEWKKLSEKELKKRFTIERSYLRTQVETLKLYTSWVRPYLESAEKLRQKGFETDAAMVNAFSTSMFELTFMATKESKPEKPFENHKLKRKYFSILLISLKYRGHVSQRVTQRGDMGFGVGGRVDISFDSYSLNSEELELFKKLKEKDEREIGISFVQRESDEALKILQEDIDHFLKEDDMNKSEKKKKNEDDINPFVALFDIFKGSSNSNKNEKKKITSSKDILKDNYVESYVRESSEDSARGFLYAVYDVYKKAHGMASSPDKFD